MEATVSKHNVDISIAKALGIMLMVMGHSGCPDSLHHFIYSFHMVLFFFLSGYFFRDDKVVNYEGQFVWRKFVHLYWPYIKWSLVFILLHNIFYFIGFNTERLTVTDMYINSKRSILGLWQGEHFLGAYWFLISLFWETIIFAFIIRLKHTFNWKYLTPVAVAALFALGFLANYVFMVDIYINRELMILPFFYAGYLAGNKQLLVEANRRNLLLVFAVCLPTIAILSQLQNIEVGQNQFGNPALYLLLSALGIYLTLCLSNLLKQTQAVNALDKIGGVRWQYSHSTFSASRFSHSVWFSC